MDLLEIENISLNRKLGDDKIYASENTPRPITGIATYVSNDLSYNSFFTKIMAENVPCLISSITRKWGGLKWIKDQTPDFDILIRILGDKEAPVPVANCGEKYYNAQKKEDQTLLQFLEYWRKYISSNYSKDTPCLYLKDWHFTRDFPDENIYRVPKYFASDWLNEYFTARTDVQDDYRFVYMGPKGSWTPFHADVFSSFSWSVNLCGKKRWILFPPGQEKYLTDKQGNLVYDVESSSLNDKQKFENYGKLEKSFEVIQNAGDAIFVPSGWHHQVWNLEDTISINHNWVNGCNIENMWFSIRKNLAAVKKEISDCRDMEDWHEHCQVMLNASYGLDYKKFCEFVLYIVTVRLKHLQENKDLKVYGDWFIGSNHLKFDLSQAKHILDKLILNEDFIKLEYFSKAESEINGVLEKINTVLDRK